ncbi:hypothetical protein B0H66DRAFT_218712 [Apodospora peruviana]|uniref:C6 transcription factor n=1 Tax=Apodospora peruviana TaxID=516989 RepID=A0AAE0IE00_9PEZI|nr:hypothetical protein B0H66DRAFT_218712 [Apodospora peruviana]
MVSTRSASAALTPRAGNSPDLTPPMTGGPKTRSSRAVASATKTSPQTFSHAPQPIVLLWLAVSIPLILWDSAYVLLRPHSMPGGKLHKPIWSLYTIYARVDYMYGFPQWEANNGFTAAQTTLNLIETVFLLAYAGLWYRHARPTGNKIGEKVVSGRPAALAVLLGFSACVMTLSKTVLYWLNEYFSGFGNIGHNSFVDLVVYWIIPNGLWLVFPTYILYQLGSEILDGLAGKVPPPTPTTYADALKKE